MRKIPLWILVIFLAAAVLLPLGFTKEKVIYSAEQENQVFAEDRNIEEMIDEAMEEVDIFLGETRYHESKLQPQSELQEKPSEVKIPSKPMDLEFSQANLEDVLRVIAEAGEFNIVLDPILKGKKIDLHLKQISINEALEVLYSAYGLSSYQINQITFISTREKIKEAGMLARIFELKNINVDEAKALIETLVNVINVSKETNTLVVMAAPEDIKKVEDILVRVDIPQPQVILEAKIIEINDDALKEIGLDWSDTINVEFQEGLRKADLDDPAAAVGSPFRIYRLAHAAVKFNSLIKMLEEEGKAKILSNPRVTTVNNKEAEIFIGDKVPYTVTTVAGGVTNTEVRFTEAGIRLKVTPSIIEEGFTLLKIEPEVSYIYRWRGPNDEYPWVKTRQATAYVRVKNKQPFVLGGLLDKQDKRNLYKVAFLGDIPILGNLFKYDRATAVNSELIITITPTIIDEKI